VSEPIKSDYGYHIIKITEQKEKGSFEDMKDQMTEELKQSKVDSDTLQTKLDEEMKAADVKVTDEDLKGAFEAEKAPTEEAPVEETPTTENDAATPTEEAK
jgi:foldase protein PrsA